MDTLANQQASIDSDPAQDAMGADGNETMGRIKRMALMQTLAVMGTTCAIVLATAIVTRVQHHADLSLPIETQRSLQDQAKLAVSAGMSVAKSERMNPGVDRQQRIVKLSSAVSTLQTIQRILSPKQFKSLAGSKLELDKVLGALQRTLQHWSASIH